jgi:hypothetical protein
MNGCSYAAAGRMVDMSEASHSCEKANLMEVSQERLSKTVPEQQEYENRRGSTRILNILAKVLKTCEISGKKDLLFRIQ